MRFRQNPLPAERFLEGPAAPPPGAGQSLDVLKALAQRRARAPELQQAHHARVEYEAGWRRTAEMAMLRAERERLRVMLDKPGLRHPVVLRQRYEDLQKRLG